MSFRRRSLIQFVLAMLLPARAAVCAGELALSETSLLGGRVKMLLPRDFEPLDDQMLRVKYPTGDRPALVYTDKTTEVNVALQHTQYQMSAEKMVEECAEAIVAFKSGFPAWSEWFRSELHPINGRPFLLFELRTPALDTRVRNIMAVTSLDNRMLVISFNVTRELERQWLAAGNRIIESIVLQ